MNWNKITEKLAPINKYIFIFNKKQTSIKYGKLCIYDPKISRLANCKLAEGGGIFWLIKELGEGIKGWNSIKTFPYWLTNKELVKLISKKEEKLDRFELLDLEE